LTGKNRLPWLALALVVAAAGCSTPRKTVTPSPHYKVGAPYKIAGRWYHPRVDEKYNRTGLASWYGDQFHGRKTANGEIFDMNRLSAAHTTLPMPSLVEIKNLENGRRIVVRVNDRGPFVDDRIIDVSRAAARRLGFEGKGLARVRVRYVGAARLADAAPAGSDRASKNAARDMPADDGITQILAALDDAPDLAGGAEEFAAAQAFKETYPQERTIAAPSVSPLRVNAVQAASGVREPIINVSKLGDEFTGARRYMIEVAALSMLDDLQGVRASLSNIGLTQISREEPEGGEPVYRITMGPFEEIGVAERRLEKVREAGYAEAAIVAKTP